MAPLSMLCTMTLDLHFQGQQFLNVNVSEIVSARTKMGDTSVLVFDIYHWMTPLKYYLYSLILT